MKIDEKTKFTSLVCKELIAGVAGISMIINNKRKEFPIKVGNVKVIITDLVVAAAEKSKYKFKRWV